MTDFSFFFPTVSHYFRPISCTSINYALLYCAFLYWRLSLSLVTVKAQYLFGVGESTFIWPSIITPYILAVISSFYFLVPTAVSKRPKITWFFFFAFVNVLADEVPTSLVQLEHAYPIVAKFDRLLVSTWYKTLKSLRVSWTLELI